MATEAAPITIQSLRGGLNDTDPAHAIADDQCTAAMNVEFFNAMLGERRGGCTPLSLTGSGLTAEAEMAHLSQWFPTNVVTLPEYIAVACTVGVSVTLARRDTGGTWHTIVPGDAINTSAPDVFDIVSQPLDANLFLAYRSGQDRLHLIDNTGALARTGLAQPAAPSVADTGSANYTSVRYFRVRYTKMSGSVVLVRSEPSATTTFTPSGTGAAARITKPASISEGETHWEVEASGDNANWYRIATVVVATTTYDDYTASSKSYPAPRGAGAPTSNDGTSITYVLLSDQAAALNLTGTVSNGSYGNPAGTIYGRGWIGYTAADVYIPAFPPTWTQGTKWYASPDVATAMEAASSGNGSNYAAIGVLSAAVGAYLNIPSARYLAVDGDRLIYGGHQTDVTLMSTVGWTPPKNDPGVGNSQRAPIVDIGGTDINTTADLDNYDGGVLTGLAASTYGTWYAFKWQRIYSAVRTRDEVRAYDIDTVSTTRGALPGSVVRAAAHDGSTTIYFLDPFIGPCKLGTGGVVTAIRGLRTTWRRINTKATKVICCGVFYPFKEQVKWWISVDGGNTPTLELVLQTSELKAAEDGQLGGGWSQADGKIATARCAAALTATVGNQTTDFPFVGLAAPDFVQRCDTGTTDNGTAFTARIVTKAFCWASLLRLWGSLNVGLLATANALGSIRVSLIKDLGVERQPLAPGVITSLAPVGSETMVVKPFDNLTLSEMTLTQVELTDGTANQAWDAQRLDLLPSLEGRR